MDRREFFKTCFRAVATAAALTYAPSALRDPKVEQCYTRIEVRFDYETNRIELIPGTAPGQDKISALDFFNRCAEEWDADTTISEIADCAFDANVQLGFEISDATLPPRSNS